MPSLEQLVDTLNQQSRRVEQLQAPSATITAMTAMRNAARLLLGHPPPAIFDWGRASGGGAVAGSEVASSGPLVLIVPSSVASDAPKIFARSTLWAAAAAKMSATRLSGMASRCFQPCTVLTGTSSLCAIGRMPPKASITAAVSRKLVFASSFIRNSAPAFARTYGYIPNVGPKS